MPERADRHSLFQRASRPSGTGSGWPSRSRVLRKDFLIDDYQVVEARVAGADAILLIAEILDDKTTRPVPGTGKTLGMAALVEFHDAANLDRVLASGADLIGINNRDLNSFRTDLEHTLRLRDRIPSDVVLVSESGIRTRADVERLEAAGISAILVGESLCELLTSGSPSISFWVAYPRIRDREPWLERPTNAVPLGACAYRTRAAALLAWFPSRSTSIRLRT